MARLLVRLGLGWAFLMLVGSVATSAWAAGPLPRLADYAHTAWNGQRGAPADVLQFTQTPDGWLWLSSPSGLFRFDGVDFQRVDTVYGHRLRSTSTLGLLTTRDGRLWVGDRFGGVSVFSSAQVQAFGAAEGLPTGAVMTMTEGPDGSVWVATSSGLGVLAPGAARFRSVGPADGLPSVWTRQVLFTRDGRQWVALEGGIYYREPGAVRFQRAWPYVNLMAMAEAPDGTLWASDGLDSHYRVRTTAPRGALARAELGGNGALFDRSGAMWILKPDALERRSAPYVGAAAHAQQLTRASGMSGPLIQTIFEDREGNLWIGTSAGVDRLRRTRLHALPVPSAFDRPAIVADGSAVIVGDWRQGVARFEGGRVEKLGSMYVSCAYRGPDGSLWLGGSEERQHRTAQGTVTRLPHPPDIKGNDVQAMTIDGAGTLWASVVTRGLYAIHDGVWRKDGGLPGLPQQRAMALATDGAGRVWAAHLGNQVSRIDAAHGAVAVFGSAHGLDLGNVLALLVDGERVWAAGQRALAWFDGQRWRSVKLADGQPLRGVSGMVRSANGDLWLHGSDGITRIAAADLARLARAPDNPLPCERFDALDGLVGSAEQMRPLPSMTQGADGRLWFATASEVTSIDPAAIARNRLPPPVQILALRSGGADYSTQGDLELRAGARELRIAYTALSLAIPERVRFRYRLEGVDEQWQDAGTRREAFYTNLGPGQYRFQVSAANEDGVWNPHGATLSFSIPPRFVDTAGFKVLLVLLGALLLGALMLLRVRQLTARMQALMHERLDERERIARGLHDTLLQSVQSLIMSFDLQARKLPVSAEQRSKIEQTLDLADALMIEGRECISDLRAAGEALELGQALTEYGRVLLQERFSVAVHGRPRRLAPHVRAELHAIAREALFNAARHANASQVELVLHYGADALALRVHDNGCGIIEAGAPGRPGHYGMQGMRERATAIGAAFSLSSTPGAGTAVQMELAAELAYAKAAPLGLLARLLPLPRMG